jgi:hypothetical protein
MKGSSVLLAYSGALGLAIAFACGSSDLTNHGSSSTGGAGGSDAGLGGSPLPVCDDSLKRCAYEFTYMGTGNETTVEVHGSFDGWGPGISLIDNDPGWTGTAELPYDQQVLYQFFIDGAAGIPDPANPNQVPDGKGGEDSVLAPETCPSYTCAPAPG